MDQWLELQKLIELTKLQIKCNELMLRALMRGPISDASDQTLPQDFQKLRARINKLMEL